MCIRIKICKRSGRAEKAGALLEKIVSERSFDCPGTRSEQAARLVAVHQTLLEYWRVSPEEVVAFGDDVNDLGFITLAGTGIAVQNAEERVKRVRFFQELPWSFIQNNSQ